MDLPSSGNSSHDKSAPEEDALQGALLVAGNVALPAADASEVRHLHRSDGGTEQWVECEDDPQLVIRHLSELEAKYKQLKADHKKLKKAARITEEAYDWVRDKYDAMNKALAEYQSSLREDEDGDSQGAASLIYVNSDDYAEGAEPHVKRQKVDGAQAISQMSEELLVFRKENQTMASRYVSDMAKNADDYMKMRDNYEKAIKWYHQQHMLKVLVHAEEHVITNVFGMPIHRHPYYNNKCLWCHRVKDTDDWDLELGACMRCSEKYQHMKAPPVPVFI
jgi:hypothetical protein